jgi:hypothetical protein
MLENELWKIKREGDEELKRYDEQSPKMTPGQEKLRREANQGIGGRATKTWPRWLDIFFAAAGVGCDWYSAFHWFSGRYSLLSSPVLCTLGLIAVLCAMVTFLAVRVGRARSREAGLIFFVASWVLFVPIYLRAAGR